MAANFLHFSFLEAELKQGNENGGITIRNKSKSSIFSSQSRTQKNRRTNNNTKFEVIRNKKTHQKRKPQKSSAEVFQKQERKSKTSGSKNEQGQSEAENIKKNQTHI